MKALQRIRRKRQDGENGRLPIVPILKENRIALQSRE
jgi:hypothetical protein